MLGLDIATACTDVVGCLSKSERVTKIIWEYSLNSKGRKIMRLVFPLSLFPVRSQVGSPRILAPRVCMLALLRDEFVE